MRNKLIVITLAACAISTSLSAQDPDLERRIDDTVRELGVLESAHAVDIHSPINSTILSLVSEGTEVNEGDLLVDLDSSSVEEEYHGQQVMMASSTARVIEAKSHLEAIQIEAQGRLGVAEMAVKVAELDLQRFVGAEGELALRKRVADAELNVARQRLQTARRMLELAAAGVDAATTTSEQYAANALAVVEAEEQSAVAEAKRRWLEEHVRGHESAVRELALRKAQLQLTQGKREFEQQTARAQAELRAAEANYQAEAMKLERLEQQMASCQIRAPRSGIVVYANPTSSRQSVAIEEGATVRQRQRVLRVVDTKRLQLRVRVHESRVNRVRVGQPVVIRFDASPTDPLDGTVAQVNMTPEPTTWLSQDSKEYAVLVSLETIPAGLRLGMTAVAEIDISGSTPR